MNFITNKTKVFSIIISAISIIALVTFIMLSTLIQFKLPSNRLTMCLIYSITLTLIVCILKGITDLFVFRDYKCQSKEICAESILNICIGALLGIVGILLACIHNKNIVWFLASFILVFAIWKGIEMVVAIRHKHFDLFIDILSAIVWLATAIFIALLIKIDAPWLLWTIIGLSWALVIINIFNILFSYVIKKPTYLETPEAIKIQKEQLEEIELAKEKERQIIKGKNAKANLEQLKQLYEKNLITQKDYDNKKKEILDNMF